MTRFLGLEPVMLLLSLLEFDIGILQRQQQNGLERKVKSYKNDFPLLNFLLKWILLCNLQHCFKMKRRKKYDLQVLNYLLKRILPFDCEIGFCVRRQI